MEYFQKRKINIRAKLNLNYDTSNYFRLFRIKKADYARINGYRAVNACTL